MDDFEFSPEGTPFMNLPLRIDHPKVIELLSVG
jgi:hypothetical protein